jgi:SAM-dependent methyltransferase
MTVPGSLPQIYAHGGMSVELYDALHPEGADGMEDTAFLLEQAAVTGGPILELACGTGRVVWPMAEAGYEIVGLDLNRAMLERAEAKAAAKPAEVRQRARFVQSGMQEFDLGSTFSLVFSTFRSFQGLLTVEDQRSCLRCAHRHLRPGGRLVLDLFDPQLDRLLPRDPYAPRSFGTPRHPVSGNLVLWESVDHGNDPVGQILTEIWRWTEVDADGRVVRQELEEIRLRWTFRYELRHLLELCGFRLLHEYSDFRKNEPAYGRELVVVCERGEREAEG